VDSLCAERSRTDHIVWKRSTCENCLENDMQQLRQQLAEKELSESRASAYQTLGAASRNPSTTVSPPGASSVSASAYTQPYGKFSRTASQAPPAQSRSRKFHNYLYLPGQQILSNAPLKLPSAEDISSWNKFYPARSRANRDGEC
jgi:hypothetical protein